MSIIASIVPITTGMDGSRSFACACGQASAFNPDASTFAVSCAACDRVLHLAGHCLVIVRLTLTVCRPVLLTDEMRHPLGTQSPALLTLY